jgi:hypothetical protein
MWFMISDLKNSTSRVAEVVAADSFQNFWNQRPEPAGYYAEIGKQQGALNGV